jgi:murein DD-endopeptidase MepM/ murein hydrolase activator NlpD
MIAFAAGCGTGPPESPTVVAPTTPPAVAPPVTPTRQAPPPTTAAASPSPPRYGFPLRAKKASFGKTHSGYPATDIFADCGETVVAVTDGVVLEINLVDRYNPRKDVAADRGGLSVSVLGDDGVRYYGSHLSSVTPGIEAGVRVRIGQPLGKVGHTGRASGVCHLHFGISPPCANKGDWWIRRGTIWPAQFLTAWRSGRALSPVSKVTAWRRANGCPAAP